MKQLGILLLAFLACAPVQADDLQFSLSPESIARSEFVRRTSLLSIEQGTAQSRKVSDLGEGGFELSEGAEVLFRKWYTSSWKDSSITWLTQLDNSLGIIWGFNTGERGVKYSISPGMTLGFVTRHKIAKNLHVSVKATTILGNRLTEKPCIADYGEVAGAVPVNCRLAATELPPEETLKYLLNESPEQMEVSVRLNWTF